MKIIAILPVSRIKYLARVLESLSSQTRKPDSLLVVFDGAEEEFTKARNMVVEAGIDDTVFVKSTNTFAGITIHDRRINISNIHNQIASILPPAPTIVPEDYEPSWVFSIEDDGILPNDALEKLVRLVSSKPDAGMVTGVELGRWGVPYVGAWRADDFNLPNLLLSAESKTLTPVIEEIDACGLYCALIRADYYVQHKFFMHNGLGPDVNLGLFLRGQGFKNYIDWSIHVTHLTSDFGLEIEIPATDNSRVVSLRRIMGNIWQSSR